MPRAKTANIELVGLDVGYSHTKIVTGKDGKKVDKFQSTVRLGEIDTNKNSTVIEFEGKKYTVGEKGRLVMDTKKTFDINFDICIATALARTHDVESLDINLVTGLPIGYYQHQKDELKDALSKKEFKIGYKGKDRTFRINECEVFPQSAGLPIIHPKDFEDKTVLVIDIGGFTVDVSYFEDGDLVSFDTYPLGVLIFRSELASAINAKFSTRYDKLDMERVIRNGIIVDEEVIPESEFDIKGFHEQHMQNILDHIKADFNYETVESKTFVGGGAIAFKDYLPPNKSIKVDEVYANAKAFYEVGTQIFG
ncbi:ParM/StbA family protein [Bacillus velezensis]|uniref:ParM/StbA family protein n=1 Tax=Bacillus velezensis TaxID=492670 RepID=UPI0011A8C82F|nr:ParM/StbA family protein [Bacillus velezensis]